MGTSTDAILFYGFHLDEGEELPFGDGQDSEDYDTWLERLGGMRPEEDPWRDLPNTDDLPHLEGRRVVGEWVKTHRDAIDAWNKRCNSARAGVTSIAFDYHCSDEYPLPFFYAARYAAARGYPQSITDLDVPDGANEELRTLAEHLGVEDPKIGWWLVSWWG